MSWRDKGFELKESIIKYMMKCMSVNKNSSKFLKINGNVILNNFDRRLIEDCSKQNM
jgi:hypothetical protein